MYINVCYLIQISQTPMHFKMGKLVVSRSIVASCFVYLLLVLSKKVAAGRMHYDNNDQLLLSDGINTGSNISSPLNQLSYTPLADGINTVSDHEDDSFVVHDMIKGMGMETNSSSEECHQMYGFLPCSTNLAGHIFLIVIYDHLLHLGESFVTHDARDLFFGKGYWGAVFFQLLDSLPEPLVLAASVGLSKNETVEEHLVIAFGMLVGSPILLLTLVWGSCIFFASRKFEFEHITTNNVHGSLQRLLSAGSGVVTDSGTSLDAYFMLLSLFPFGVILIPRAVGVSSAYESFFLFLALLAAVLCLFIYFFCQHVDHRILERIMEHAEIDRKMEMCVPFYDVQTLMRQRNKHLMSMGIEMEMNMGNDHKMIIGRDGVGVTFKQWFFSKIQSMEDPNSHRKFNQVARLLFEEKVSLMKVLIEGMALHDFLKDNDETRRQLAIDRLFENIDIDGNSTISSYELKRFLESRREDKKVDEELFEIIMTRLDVDGNGDIDREEFKIGMTAWFWEIEQHYNTHNHETDDDQHRRINEAKGTRDKNSLAIVFLVIGISMLTIFAEPLTHSVQVFSESVNIPPLYISLILVPWVANYRAAFAAIQAARKKRHHMTTSTFSEMYHKVMMNNLMGFALLLCVMIYRGLTWHFSAEVLTLVIVCGIVGFLTGRNSKFPNWTLIIAFPLYPLSFMFYFLVNIHFR